MTRRDPPSMRVTVPSPALVTQMLPPDATRSSGASPTGMRVTWLPSTRATASSPPRATQTAPPATTGLSGWRPTASGLPCARPVAASKRWSVPALALVTHTRPSATVMPSGPGAVSVVVTSAGSGVAVASGVAAAGSSPATNAATASISAADRVSLKAGIVPLPLLTVALTVAASGLRSSRFGPDVAGRVRARERVAAAAVGGEDRLAVGRGGGGGPGGGGLVRLRPDQRRPGEQQDDGEGRGHPDDGREESVDLPQHVRARGSRSRR